MNPKESDWKKFRNSLDRWRERYLKRKNEEIRAILEKKDPDETGKFWDKSITELSGRFFQIKYILAYGSYEKARNDRSERY
jgi:hypothetical protein